MEISILYICTGDYINFFPEFHKSCEEHFIPEMPKKYFIFTDQTDSEFFNIENILLINIDKLSWPLNTLLRYNYFERVLDEIIKSKYTFFFNANALFVKKISSSIIKNRKLVGVIHPGYEKKMSFRYPWERRRNLTCTLSYFKRGIYYQGCFNGGESASFIELIKKCSHMTNLDLKSNLIAKVHDESYLNFYFYYNKPEALSILYAWPEVYGVNNDAYILMRDKSRESWYDNFK